ncbi:MAG: DUF6027 family protein [Thermoleophilia bacterium]|nr:DUF6027 family protein [Thermoleophilia bacterium]
MAGPDDFDPGGAFRAQVRDSLASDPMPALSTLAGRLGIPVEQVVHFALHRWASAGSEALLAGPPEVLGALRDAAEAGDLDRVRGIARFLLSAYEEDPA